MDEGIDSQSSLQEPLYLAGLFRVRSVFLLKFLDLIIG